MIILPIDIRKKIIDSIEIYVEDKTIYVWMFWNYTQHQFNWNSHDGVYKKMIEFINDLPVMWIE